MRRPFVCGNWKMNLLRESAVALASTLARAFPAPMPGAEVAVCPPFPYLTAVAEAIRGSAVALGAQDVSPERPGAFTGEVACEMLLDCGCTWVIIGHSERRHLLGETDATINRKLKTAVERGLRPIFCIGELLSERNAGLTEQVLDRQLGGGLAGMSKADVAALVIAYEPVWAIGTGVTATNEQAESAHVAVRGWLERQYDREIAENMRILYGGSVKPENAAGLIGMPNVDGALVGGASLKAEQFVPINPAL